MRITKARHQTFDASTYQALTTWYESALGQHLLNQEQELINASLNRRFGYRMLQLGCANQLLHEQSPIGHKFSFCAYPDVAHCHTAVAKGDAIPLASDSVDLVLLHHALDFSNHQHQLLREVARVLISGGHLVIVGFNPFSTWGIRNKLHLGSCAIAPWNAQTLTRLRLTDWLTLLDFQVDKVSYAGYSMPINAERVIRYSGWLEPLARKLNWPTGAVYIISARKQVMPLTPVQLHWRRLPALGRPVPEPASRTSQSSSPTTLKIEP